MSWLNSVSLWNSIGIPRFARKSLDVILFFLIFLLGMNFASNCEWIFSIFLNKFAIFTLFVCKTPAICHFDSVLINSDFRIDSIENRMNREMILLYNSQPLLVEVPGGILHSSSLKRIDGCWKPLWISNLFSVELLKTSLCLESVWLSVLCEEFSLKRLFLLVGRGYTCGNILDDLRSSMWERKQWQS